MTTIRIALSGFFGCSRTRAVFDEAYTELAPLGLPAKIPILVSYVYRDTFLEMREHPAVDSWALDSGAFSAYVSGTPIELAAYMDFIRSVESSRFPPADIFALDVIGDPRASRINADLMWDAGVKAVPTFHIGEPDEILLELARDFPKIALGGFARMSTSRKLAFARHCFRLVWPKRLHGFGCASPQLMEVPWHSVDASTWDFGPAAFRTWQQFGQLPFIPRKELRLSGELLYFMKLQDRIRVRWASTLASIP